MSRIAVVAGEDAAPEAVEPTIDLLGRLEPHLEFVYPVVGQAAVTAEGDPFPASARALFDRCDAALFGATSGASVRALFHLRWGRQTYANVRPIRWSKGYASPLARPEGVDLVIVRENLEDLYAGVEGDLADLAPLNLASFTWNRPVHELAPGRFTLKVITERGSERVAHYAFELARRRKAAGARGQVTAAQKHNMLFGSDGLFAKTSARVAAHYPDISFETLIIDDFAHRLVVKPQSFDVVVMPNLYGDILSDAAAGLLGGLGLAPSGCYGEDFAYFEPAHGTAPDLVGRGVINPTATLLSGAMLLDHLGLSGSADRLRTAISDVYGEAKWLTLDQGGSTGTSKFCEAVSDRL